MVDPDRVITPMLARSVDRIPSGMAYEPKWDGWRCLIMIDDGVVSLISRRGNDLTGDYPELVAAAEAMLPDDCIVDGEIVIVDQDRLDYTMLAHRHGAGARAARLAAEHPAHFVAFDLISIGGLDVMAQPQRRRRELLIELMAGVGDPMVLTPSTLDLATAERWFSEFEGYGLDGVIARPLDQPYQPGVRSLLKIKHRRTTDVVVGGYRLDRNASDDHPTLGSLQLGLYEGDVLHYVGVCAGFPGGMRVQLGRMLAELAVSGDASADHPWDRRSRSGARLPEGINRWSRSPGRLILIEPELVCEVNYEAVRDDGEGRRFRSNTAFVRWRADKDPRQCRFDQLDEPAGEGLAAWLADQPSPET